jgi:hypothetical protein
LTFTHLNRNLNFNDSQDNCSIAVIGCDSFGVSIMWLEQHINDVDRENDITFYTSYLRHAIQGDLNEKILGTIPEYSATEFHVQQ